MAKAKKIGLWIGAFLICGLLLASISLIVLLRTDFARRYVLKFATQEIHDAIGGRVEIGSASIHWASLGADFYAVTIYGAESTSALPLFSADRGSINFRLHLFRSSKLAIADLTLDHPVLRLTFDSKGRSNLPPTSSATSTPSSSGNLFDVAIGHFVLNAGEIIYNDRRVPISADLRDLAARSVYESSTPSYNATLSYRDSVVIYGALAPFTHDLQASLTASPSGLTLKSLLVRSGSSSLRAQGQLTNYSSPSLTGSYQASLSSGELAKILAPSPATARLPIAGQVDTDGSFAYRSSASESAINGISLDGKFTSRTLAINLPQAQAAAQSLRGKYALHRGVLDASNLQADALGGHVNAHLIIRQLATVSAAHLDADAKGVSLAAIRNALPVQNRTPVRIDGRMDGNVRADWHGSMEGVRLLSNATMTGSIAPAGNAIGHSSSFPIKAAVHAAYDAPKQLLTLRDSSTDTPHSHLSASGILGSNANLQIEARSDDLREIDLLALAFRPTPPASDKIPPSAPPELLGLGGSATVNGTVSGQLANPHFGGRFAATNLQLHGASLQSVQASIQASVAGVAAHDGTIRNGSRGQVNFDISLGLRNWSPAPDQSVAARLTASTLSVADIEHIAGFQYPISGVLAANLTISGTEETPNAQGNVHLTQAVLWQQPVQDANVDLKTSGDSLLTSLTLRTPAGNATSTLAYNPKSQDYDLQATLQAIRLDQVKYLQDHAQSVTGVLSISAQGHGNTKAPQMELTINSQQLKIGEQSIEAFAARAGVSQDRATFDLKGSVSGAALQAQGTVNLSGDYQANAKIDSEAIQLGQALASFSPQSSADFHGQTQFHGTLTGPLRDPDQLEAHLEFPSFNVGYREVQLAAAAPIHIDYKRGVWIVQRTELRGTGTDLTVEATVPSGGTANLQATANGKLDLRLLQIWNPDWQSSGEVTLNVGARGDRAHPVMSGTLSVSDGAIAIENAPALEKIAGELDVAGDRIQVKTLTAQMGGGDVEVHGFAIYRPSMQYNLGVTAREVRLLYPAGVRTQLTANLYFAGGPDDANLTGQVSINRLSLTQSFDLGTFTNAFGSPSSPPTGMAQNVKLNVAVSSRQELELSSSQLSIQGSADFRVRGTLAEPVLIGRTDLTGGELFFNARRFQIQNASIQFANPVRTEPVVNLTATTTVDQFNLTVNLVGPFDRLRTTYTSDPPLPPVDVINLLISGQTTEAAQGSTTSPQSVIAGQLTGQVSNRLQKLTGISSLTIDPQIGGNQGNAASQLAIQERVTKNLFFTFATDVTTTQGVVVQVEYQITPKYSMSAVRDQTGGYEIEIKAHKKF